MSNTKRFPLEQPKIPAPESVFWKGTTLFFLFFFEFWSVSVSFWARELWFFSFNCRYSIEYASGGSSGPSGWWDLLTYLLYHKICSETVRFHRLASETTLSARWNMKLSAYIAPKRAYGSLFSPYTRYKENPGYIVIELAYFANDAIRDDKYAFVSKVSEFFPRNPRENGAQNRANFSRFDEYTACSAGRSVSCVPYFGRRKMERGRFDDDRILQKKK